MPSPGRLGGLQPILAGHNHFSAYPCSATVVLLRVSSFLELQDSENFSGIINLWQRELNDLLPISLTRLPQRIRQFNVCLLLICRIQYVFNASNTFDPFRKLGQLNTSKALVPSFPVLILSQSMDGTSLSGVKLSVWAVNRPHKCKIHWNITQTFV